MIPCAVSPASSGIKQRRQESLLTESTLFDIFIYPESLPSAHRDRISYLFYSSRH